MNAISIEFVCYQVPNSKKQIYSHPLRSEINNNKHAPKCKIGFLESGGHETKSYENLIANCFYQILYNIK